MVESLVHGLLAKIVCHLLTQTEIPELHVMCLLPYSIVLTTPSVSSDSTLFRQRILKKKKQIICPGCSLVYDKVEVESHRPGFKFWLFHLTYVLGQVTSPFRAHLGIQSTTYLPVLSVEQVEMYFFRAFCAVDGKHEPP